MTNENVKILEERFYAYTDPFLAGAEDPFPYTLKQEHTIRVCENITKLAHSQKLDADTVNMAKMAALAHDLGRFPQFKRYGTFSDSLSTNHGALGVGVLVKNGILSGFLRKDKKLILRAVALHNRPRLPRGLAPQLELIAKLLRDADKIDIYRVMKAHYQSAVNGASFLTHNLPDDGRVSPELVSRLMEGQEIHFSRVSTVNDMKLFQMSMIQDLNFAEAFRIVLGMGMIEAIIDSMPPDSCLTHLAHSLNSQMERAQRE